MNRLFPMTALAAALSTLPGAAHAQDQGGQQEQEPQEVATMEVTLGEVPVVYEYSGRIAASREVEVRARVGGILLERRYEEGERVDGGQPLYRIDPALFEADVESARAEVERARAALDQAARTERRNVTLGRQGSVSEATRDEAVAARELAEADLAAAEAALRSSELSLAYTDVTAPLGGVTSLGAVPEGSLIAAGDLLTRINQLDPAHVNFSVADTEAAELRRLRREAGLDRATVDERISVEVVPGGAASSMTGRIDFTAPTISTDTGTRRARTVLENPDDTLVPGQFVRVRLIGLSLFDAVELPAAALAQGPEGTYVYTISDDGLAETIAVEVAREKGDTIVVVDGVEDGETIVTEGVARIRVGAPIRKADAGAGGGDGRQGSEGDEDDAAADAEAAAGDGGGANAASGQEGS